MPVELLRRLSYIVPFGAVLLLDWLGDLSWWALAMLIGGSLFAWDWLWGDRQLLDAGFGLTLTGLGLACLAAGYFLADGLNLSLSEFQNFARDAPRRERLVYRLPGIGVGLTLYGLLIWSRAWLRDREERW